MRRARYLVLLITLFGCRSIPNSAPRVASVEHVPPPAEAPRTDVRTDEADDVEVIRACPSESPAAKLAAQALQGLDTKVTALAADADPTAVVDDLRAFLASKCFELAEGDLGATELGFENALSLQVWWADGGWAWARHYLTLASGGYSIVFPTPRKTLTSADASHPLAPILCPGSSVIDSNATCGRDTKGWVRRMQNALERMGREHVSQSESDCAEQGKKAEPIDRYDTFRGCIDGISPPHEALPIGRFKSPADGWLTMKRDGDCGTMYAYGLADGSAYVIDSCRGATKTQAGRVSTAALREATFALFMKDYVDESVRTTSVSFSLPLEIEPFRAKGGGAGIGGLWGGGGSTSMRHWTWLRGRTSAVQAEGDVDMFGGYRDASRYAVELVEAMEDAFEPGCAPSSPPSSITTVVPKVPGPCVMRP